MSYAALAAVFFWRSIANVNQTGVIYQANSWIKENFRDAFSVEELAGQRNMSVSQFHQRFKSEVDMGPLPCQKRLWLMLDGGANVTRASRWLRAVICSL